MVRLTVSKTRTGEGCFRTLKEAVAALPGNAEYAHIFLDPGIYHEKVELLRPNVTIQGHAATDTILEYGDYARQEMPDGSKRGTFRSYVLYLAGRGCALLDMTVRNTAAPRKEVGQAIALSADADLLVVRNCRLEGRQDTLFTGPLPPEPILPGSFVGPGEFAPREPKRQFYENCVISGEIDFIFGGATAWFENCEIVSLRPQKMEGAPADASDGELPPGICGYVTAASTPKDVAEGYVFSHCNFTGDCPKDSVYLGRPWRNYAKTVLLHCAIGGHIRKEGFCDWGKKEAQETVFYAEYQSRGPGAAPNCRAPFVRQLTDLAASRYEAR